MKNVNCISNWRDDYTQYQKKKLCEYLEKTYEEIKEEENGYLESKLFYLRTYICRTQMKAPHKLCSLNLIKPLELLMINESE